MLLIYADNIVITNDDTQEISELKLYLQKKFQTIFVDNCDIILGIEIARSKNRSFSSNESM